MRAVMELLGHSNIDTTADIYISNPRSLLWQAAEGQAP